MNAFSMGFVRPEVPWGVGVQTFETERLNSVVTVLQMHKRSASPLHCLHMRAIWLLQLPANPALHNGGQKTVLPTHTPLPHPPPHSSFPAQAQQHTHTGTPV
jgi:hypothetical protein